MTPPDLLAGLRPALLFASDLGVLECFVSSFVSAHRSAEFDTAGQKTAILTR